MTLLWRRIAANGGLFLAICAVAALRFNSPSIAAFYPICPLYRYFHILCPGCGSTRATIALLHGKFALAMKENPLFVSLLPFLASLAVLTYLRLMKREPFQWPDVPEWILKALLILALGFMLVRNTTRYWG
jgi:hypothetical protein